MIYVNKTRDMDREEWDRIVDALGLRPRLAAANTVLIKPNLAAGTYVDPSTHVISDFRLLKSAVEYVHAVNPGAVIYIAESDSTGYGFAYLKFEHLNLPACLELPKETEKQVRLLDMTRDRLRLAEDRRFLLYTNIDRQLWLSETLLNADFTVSLSNLKTHAVTGYTGACKNLFGCLPDFDKSVNHPRIHRVIHDLTIAIHPDLSVVDAFYGMEKNGPVQGADVDTGYRVMSDDAVEADLYAAATIGYPPKKIKYLRLLCKTLGRSMETEARLITPYKKAGLFLRIMNAVGLFFQRCGQAVAAFGHRVHSCPTPAVLAITLVRPVLLRVFDYEKLKAWKRKILK